MKRKLLVFGTSALFLMGVAFFTSCGTSQNDETEEEQVESIENETTDDKSVEENTETEQVAAAYACPMHPEITGNENDKCSECGMALEKVESEQTAAAYACPMHPEETGKEGDKCSQCGMALEKAEKKADESEEMEK